MDHKERRATGRVGGTSTALLLMHLAVRQNTGVKLVEGSLEFKILGVGGCCLALAAV